MYKNARAFNEAVVRGRKHDEFGYPLIFVAWDHNHWAYSGEDDRWVLEAHFDLVGDMADKDKNEDFIKQLGELFKRWESDDEPQDEDEPVEANGGTHVDEAPYEDTLEMAIKDARNGEAFIIMVARKEEYGGMSLVVPHIYMHSKRDDAALMLESTTADLAAQSHARLSAQLIDAAKRDNGPSSS